MHIVEIEVIKDVLICLTIVAGLALGLETDISGVWLNTGATALHKFVIAFSVGVELITNKVGQP